MKADPTALEAWLEMNRIYGEKGEEGISLYEFERLWSHWLDWKALTDG